MKRNFLLCFSALVVLVFSAAACKRVIREIQSPASANASVPAQSPSTETRPLPANAPDELKRMLEAALEQPQLTKTYDASYVKLDYPGGDVPADRGACTDVVIRALRKSGLDLQKELHEDMNSNFSAYPRIWGLSKTDSNIDHRRVLNLMTWFSRKGKAVGISREAGDYQPGDIVAWDLGNKMTHIGIVSNQWSNDTNRFLMIHNIGAGAQIEDVLFAWNIIGHYRYYAVK